MSETEHHTRSAAAYARARDLIPGGVNSPVRAFAAVGGTPFFVDRAEGPYLWDIDGNRYIDWVMSWGPLIHGHAFPPVVEAVVRAARRGTSYGAPHPAEVKLAEMITDAMPSVEMVRFVNSGTEAAMSAIRLARAWTEREIIVKFAGHYHGHADMLLAEAGSGGLTFGVPTSPGVPAGAAASTVVAPFNHPDALEQLFRAQGEQIAAVIVEPIAGNMGVVPPSPHFLSRLRELTAEAGSLLIADEVITGFRVSEGGAQRSLGLWPDLTVLGKIIGGGLPVGAYGGRREIMERIAPSGPVYQAGTLAGNPLAMAAGIANLEPLRDERFYGELETTTGTLASGLRAAAAETRVPVTVNAVTGMLTVFFTEGPVATLDEARRSDAALFGRFFHAMLRRGIYLPPSQYEAWMVSAAHTPEIAERTIEAAREALGEISSSSCL